MLIKKKPKTDYAKTWKWKLEPWRGCMGNWDWFLVQGFCTAGRLWAQWRWAANWPSSVVCVCVAVLVKTNEFSLQSLRCLDSAHRIAAPEFSLGRSQAIPQRESIDLPPPFQSIVSIFWVNDKMCLFCKKALSLLFAVIWHLSKYT